MRLCREHLALSFSLSLSNSRENSITRHSVRLLGGTGQCSGRLEVNSNPSWSSVCEADFDQQDAQVVCRQLGCGAPSVLQGALYGEGEAPMWTKEFQCGGHESALLDCSSASERNTCSPGTAVSLTCSEPVRLVGGESRCAGYLEVKHQGEWRPVEVFPWTLTVAAIACRELDCGSAVSVGVRKASSKRPVWVIYPLCLQSGSALRECAYSKSSPYTLTLTCSESVRLVGGSRRCEGDLELNHQGEWRTVGPLDEHWTLKEAAVACRDLDCGSAVSVGVRKASSRRSLWGINTRCLQSGSALRECARSVSSSNTLTLTCSEPFRLVGGESRCAGDLEVKHQGDWRPMWFIYSLRNLKGAGVLCRELDCGFAVSVGTRHDSSRRPVWEISSDCFLSGSALSECAGSSYSSSWTMTLTCSDSVRLLGGTGRCSGRLEVNSDPSNPSWSSVCEADFDQQDAQVVCRQLGCGAPSVLQGALYGEGEAPMWTKEFQCGGHESALLDCSSASERNTCSPGRAVSLTCSEPVRLVGGESRCEGALEVKHQGEWRPVRGYPWTLKEAAVACRELECGSAVSVGERKESLWRDVWGIRSACLKSGSLRECAQSDSSRSIVNLTCSGGSTSCPADCKRSTFPGLVKPGLGEMDGIFRSHGDFPQCCSKLKGIGQPKAVT
ncbi:hypothetical protein NQZ68_010922 [Dissostichus eleginoides]|nr:hypothetical protein NQZ68_010922 [Dissostichus eleginoides]